YFFGGIQKKSCPVIRAARGIFLGVSMLLTSIYRARQGKNLPLTQVLLPLTIGKEVLSLR
ncbi:MAG: hypothetical protein J6S60_06755, partial [Oscillospiraceae bacterium]|nr:hypothetical protein [Oscillospiraceae bacterium]